MNACLALHPVAIVAPGYVRVLAAAVIVVAVLVCVVQTPWRDR